MITYVNEIKRQLRDKYNFVPVGGTEQEPIFDSIPDGTYPMEIDGKVDHVEIKDGKLKFGNFKQ